MKFKFLSLILVICAGIGFVGCSSDSPDEPSGTTGKGKMRLEKMDLSGATALTLLGNETKAEGDNNVLFKIDDNGNMTAVKLEVIVDEEGNKTSVRTDISVSPRAIFNLAGKYTYFYDCEFFNINTGSPVSFDYGVHWPFCMLVNNSTGKIYVVPNDANEYFSSVEAVTDKKGDLYLHHTNGGVIAKVTFTSDSAVIEPYGPKDLNWHGHMHLLDNGTIAITNEEEYYKVNFVYSNGGFETLDKQYSEDYYAFSAVDEEIWGIEMPASNFLRDDAGNYVYSDVSLSLVKVNAGTSFGGITISTPVATIKAENVPTDYRDYMEYQTNWYYLARNTSWWYFKTMYAYGDYIFLDYSLAYNRSTGQWRNLAEEGLTNHIVLPTEENGYKGKVWNIYRESNVAHWFDPISFSYGYVNLPSFDSYVEISWVENIPDGKYIRTMLSPYDGKKHVFTIDIETGQYTQTDVVDNKEVINLIPLN